MNYEKYIERDVTICGGEPMVKGTRMTVRVVIAFAAASAAANLALSGVPHIA